SSYVRQFNAAFSVEFSIQRWLMNGGFSVSITPVLKGVMLFWDGLHEDITTCFPNSFSTETQREIYTRL
ncbi:MAG: hypothetical protein CMJ47_09780, partial [Planctomyces sp.]|nr:hypothetical protein [Planctomyces sp.]